MNFTAFFIRRPAFTIVISSILIILGIISFNRLAVRWIPSVKPPQVWINTIYAGASALAVEQDVTKVLEENLSGIDGVDNITSVSRRGRSRISIVFKLGANIDSGVEEIRSRIEQIRNTLPKDADAPNVVKADPDSNAIMYIAFFDNNKTATELSEYIEKYILPSFQTVDGVGRVDINGERLPAIQIHLDPARMAAADIAVDDITNALYSRSISLPSGFIKGYDHYYNVLVDNRLQTADEFNQLILRSTDNQVIRLKDVGQAELAAPKVDKAFRINGQSGIALGIIPQANANPLLVDKAIKRLFNNLQTTLPNGLKAKILYDQADYIRASINSVYEALFEAILFVWLVILIFLCRLRATLIPIITIPVCLIASFAVMYYFNFTINTISLMALVLAIGLVVDDAIVMLENISRYIEQGMPVMSAALRGSKEIIFPIIAMTITLAAVYAPIAFTPGLLGVLFKEFTFTLAGAVLISGIIALTLTPMMCARLLAHQQQPNRYQQWFEQKFYRLQTNYIKYLKFILHYRLWVMIGAAVFATGIGYSMYRILPAELSPNEDMQEIDVYTQASNNASFDYTENFVKQLESYYAQLPDIESFLTIHFAPQANFQILILKPAKQRHFSIPELIDKINQQGQNLTGVRINAFTPPSPLTEVVSSNGGQSLGMVLMTNGDYKKLQSVADMIMQALKSTGLFNYTDHSLKWDTDELQLNVDQDRAADLKLNVANISNTISTLIAGRSIGKTDDYDINLSLSDQALQNPNIFQQLYSRNADGKMISLAGVISTHAGATASTFMHYEKMRADNIYLNLAPGYTLDQGVATIQKIAKENLPGDIKYQLLGQAKDFLDSQGKTIFTFGLALIFIYLILVAQFESFIDPFIILLTVPFAVIGALLTLKIFGGSLNIYSNIGMITLVGLIAKHGILITEFANQERRNGQDIDTAILHAAKLRLRPILMTTAAMILGAIPLAVAMGQGAETRQQIGLVITGGMLIGTIFSLFIIPVAYRYLSPLRSMPVVTVPNEENINASTL